MIALTVHPRKEGDEMEEESEMSIDGSGFV